MTLERFLETVAAMIVLAAPLSCQSRPPATGQAPAALDGSWRLHLGRSHYGPGVDRRAEELMDCSTAGERLQCVVTSRRADGRELVARFAASFGNGTAPVSGMPDVDAVQLSRPQPSLLDATFLARGVPVFAYRAMQSDDGKSLMIIAVHPVTRAAMTTVVVYDRR